MAFPTRTHLAFHYDGKLSEQSTTIQAVFPANQLDDANRTIYKGINITAQDYIVITSSTLFHPQGGGQPSDTGTMHDPSTNTTFNVTAVRMAASSPCSSPPTPISITEGQVLHLGTFTTPHPFHTTTPTGTPTTITQHLNTQLRNLYSRYHTAGHVLGSAVRHLLQHQIPNFDELKASHFPDSASCEFQGLIPGTHKEAIQQKVDEFLARDMPVEINFWSEDDFRQNGLERLIPDRSVLGGAGAVPGEKFRVVKIVGAEVYPCGGTHVDSTALCGKTTVRKISRQKGNSRVSYAVE